jgi:hypothetical protein
LAQVAFRIGLRTTARLGGGQTEIEASLEGMKLFAAFARNGVLMLRFARSFAMEELNDGHSPQQATTSIPAGD